MKNLIKKALRRFLGGADLEGNLRVGGITAEISVRRDRFGVPIIEAQNDPDAWFGLGFCHGVDRTGQVDFFRRAALGRLSELLGKKGLPVDRLARRIGFQRSALKQFPLLAEDARRTLEAYASGVTAGIRERMQKKPLEFRLLRSNAEEWQAPDILAFLKLLSFLLPSNWDVELARLKIAVADGAEAVLALDPALSASGPFVNDTLKLQKEADRESREANLTSKITERLSADLSEFLKIVPAAGGSNNWVLSGKKTTSGRPILANDPHLSPMLPPPWYLAQIRTPRWAMAGAGTPGSPCFAAGHNGFAAWGATAALHDNTDFFLEVLGADGKSVWDGDRFVPCAVVEERIRVKGGDDVVEKVLVTPRGPIVTGAFEGITTALSMKSVWLEPLPLRGLLDAHKVRSFSEFREAFKQWPLMGQYLVYADTSGEIAWQLVGQVPCRAKNWGMLPLDGCRSSECWRSLVPFDEMLNGRNPLQGFFATANNPPVSDGQGPYLGHDWVSGYRASVICDALGAGNHWNIERCMALQCAKRAKPWEAVRDAVLGIKPAGSLSKRALKLLEGWHGELSPGSAAATIYVYFFCEVATRCAKAKAPNSWEWAMGKGFSNLMPFSLFADRKFEHVVRIIQTQPPGWFKRPWAEELSDALERAARRVEKESGRKLENAAWGQVRPIVLKHLVFGEAPVLKTIFNSTPIPGGGDSNTPFQCTVNPLDPKSAPLNIPNLRVLIDVGDWSNSRYVLCGGQSGDPLSPHYTDMLALWQKGEGVRIPWTEDEIKRESSEKFRIEPVLDTAGGSQPHNARL